MWRKGKFIGTAVACVGLLSFLLSLNSTLVYATSPAFTGTIPNQIITEDASTNNAFDLDSYFSDSDPGDSCTYSAIDGLSLATMTLDGDGTVDFTSASTSNGYVAPTTSQVLLLHGDGTNGATTIEDSGVRSRLVTVAGNTQISTTQSKFGGSSIYMDGSGDYLSIASTSDFALGSTFTIETFIYPTALQALNLGAWVVDFRGGSTNNWTLGTINSGGVMKPYAYANGTGYTGTTTITLNEWHHLAYVYSGNVMTLYVDGVASGTLNMTYSQAATSLILGARYSVNQEYITGYMDDIRITKGTAVYTGNFTPATSAFDNAGFTSRIFDAATSVSWNTLAWTPDFPTYKQLPNSAATETAYNSGNAAMTNNILLMHLNEGGSPTSFTDSSGSSNTGSCSGSACPTATTNGKFNNAQVFDGANTYINAGSEASVDDVTVKTIEAWIYPTGWGESGAGRIVAKSNNSNGSGFNFLISSSSSVNRLEFMQSFSGAVANWATPTSSIALNNWYHVVVTYDRSSSSNVPTMYINGVAQTLTTVTSPSGTASSDAAQSVVIGARTASASDRNFTGTIDEVAVYGRALSAAEVLTRYKRGAAKMKYQVRSCDDAACSGESFAGPVVNTTTHNNTLDFDQTDEGNYTQESAMDGTDFSSGTTKLTQLGNNNIKSLVHFNNSVTDYGAYGSTWSASNVTYNASGKFSDSGIFNGSSSVITATETTGSDWDLGTTYTIEFWVKPTTTSFGRMISTRGSSGTDGYEIYSGACTGTPCTGTLGMSHGQNSNTNVISAAGALTKDTWNHVAITGDATTRRMFVNGTMVASGGVINVLNSSLNQPLTIGRSAHAAYGEWFGGEFDEVTILKGEARYTGNFTAPTAPYTGEGNTKLLVHADGSNGSTTVTDSSVSARTITTNGNAQISTTQSKFGGSSMYVDGTGDYFSVPDSSDFAFRNGDFTVELWAYANTPSHNGSVISKSTSSSVGPWLIHQEGSNWTFYSSSNGTSWDVASGTVIGAIDFNTWTHLTISRQGSSIRLYKNGTLGATVTTSATLITNTANVLIGRLNYTTPADFTGYVDEVRLTKGIARYTSNFTPSASAFTDNSGYPTSQAYYVTTGSANTISLANTSQINSVTATVTQPTNTTIKSLVSFNGRSTWKYYSAGWQTAAGGLADLQTSGMTIAALQTALTNQSISSETNLDFAFDLATTDSTATPSIDHILVNTEEKDTSTSDNYYSEWTNTATGLPSLSLGSTVSSNRYFQYKSFIQAENASYLPKLRSVSITASNGTYADTTNVTSGFAGGTATSCSYQKDSSDTVQFRCTDTTAATADSNSVTVAYAQTFTAAATGNWNIGTTWGGSCSSSCTEGTDYPRYSDNVTIAGGYTVTLPVAITASFNNLTIGGGAAGALTLVGNIGTGANITVLSNGTLTQQNTTTQTISGTLDVQGTLTHATNSTSKAYVVDFAVNTASIAGTVTGSGKGFAISQGTGAGTVGPSSTAQGAGGGAHAGYGGAAGSGGGQTSVAYGNPVAPTDLGSGGGDGYGTSSGGAGGGAIKLVTSGNLTVSGSIVADGSDGDVNGGGAGGSIYVTVGGNANYTSATVTADGGAGINVSWDGGGAGGGRIALLATGTYTAPTNLHAFGGYGPEGASDGGTGSLYVSSASDPNGTLTYNNASVVNSSNAVVSNTNYLSGELITGTNMAIGNFSVINTMTLTVPDTAITSISNTFSICSDCTVTLKSYTNASTALSVGTLTVNGTLVHTDHTTGDGSTLAHKVKISATTVNVNNGGSISLNGRGYAGRASNTAGLGTGAGAAGSAAIGGGGGAHDGAGGNGSGASSPTGIGGSPYDTNSAPIDLGSSGGGSNNASSTGGDGGGAVEISASGTVTVDGTITANGGSGGNGGDYGAGGGGGGSVYLTFGTLTGAGTISATGGTGGNGATTKGGGGGGGRVALSGTYSFSGTVTCTGGSATSTATAGNDCNVYALPNTPTITSPTAGQTGVARIPTITSSAYSGIGSHNTTSWQISDNNTFSNSDCTDTNIVWCKMSDGSNKTSIAANATNGTFQNALNGQTKLNINTTYYVRARYTNSTGNSSWSNSIAFTTTAVANITPVASSSSINTAAAAVTLTENTTTTVTATSTITDSDGCSDLSSVQAKFYRTSVGSGASDDDNNHYTVSCAQDGGSCTGGADTTATYTCTINTQYFADPTDAGSVNASDTWSVLITPTDVTEPGTTDSDTIEMNTLTALNATSSIAFGALALGANSDTTNQSVTITNTGNEGIDVSLSGYGSAPSDGYALSCTIGTVPIASMKYSTATFDYDLAGTALTSSAFEKDLDVPQRTGVSTTGTVYWGLGMPSTGVGGSCTGTITTTPVSDPLID